MDPSRVSDCTSAPSQDSASATREPQTGCNPGSKLKYPAAPSAGDFGYYIPDSPLYMQLLELEKKIDAIVNRKKFDILDQRSKIKTIRRTLRIFVSNTFYDPLSKVKKEDEDGASTFDAQVTGDTSVGEVAEQVWTLAVEGRLLELPRSRKSQGINPKFSTFVKSIIVQFGPSEDMVQVDNPIVEWNKPAEFNSDFDGFEIKRKGNKNFPVKIIIQIDHKPEVFKLVKPLSDLLDIHTDIVSNIILALWKYIKLMNLQDKVDKNYINCNPELEKIFNQKRILLSDLPRIIRNYLLPPDPVVIDYVINTGKEYTYSDIAYDISVDTMNLFAKQKSATLLLASTTPIHRDIATLNKKIQGIIKEIYHVQLRRDFLSRFVSDPLGFMEKWIASQSKDLETILGEPWSDITEIGKRSLFTTENARNAIAHYLSQEDPSYGQSQA